MTHASETIEAPGSFAPSSPEIHESESSQSAEVPKFQENLNQGFREMLDTASEGRSMAAEIPEALTDPKFNQALDTLEVSADVAREILAEEKLAHIPDTLEVIDTPATPERQEARERLERYHAIRMTEHLPKFDNGRMILETPMAATNGDIARPTLHFTLNEKVGSHTEGQWDSPSFAVVAPMASMLERNGMLYGLGNADTYWLVDEGVELPEGTTILVSEKGSADPRLRVLEETAQSQGLDIRFQRVPKIDDEVVETHLAQAYEQSGIERPARLSSEDEQNVRGQLGITTGGYGAHKNSWLADFERTFMHGQPGMTSSIIPESRLAIFTPLEQIRLLAEHQENFPPKLLERYRDLASRHVMEIVQAEPEQRHKFFQAHLEAGREDGAKPSDAEIVAAENEFYGDTIDILLNDGPDHGMDKNRAEQLTSTLMSRVLERGGIVALEVLGRQEGQLSVDQVDALRQAVTEHQSPELLQYTAEAVQESPNLRGWYEQQFGPAFVEKALSTTA